MDDKKQPCIFFLLLPFFLIDSTSKVSMEPNLFPLVTFLRDYKYFL